MRRIEFGAVRMMPLGTAVSPGNRQIPEFEALVLPLMDSAYNLARWFVRNDHDAEDLVQETYLKSFRSFPSFQSGTNFRAWMYRILRNTYLNSRTGLRAASTVSLDSEEEGPELAVENETPETTLMKGLSSQLIQSAIDDLPVNYREVLLLCDVEEMSYREIAEILSIPIGTVMSRLARARKQIREFLRVTSAPPPSTSMSRKVEAPETANQTRFWASHKPSDQRARMRNKSRKPMHMSSGMPSCSVNKEWQRGS
jgi:RNA polymerase sigma-70 factor, ECF subfamily